MGDVYVIAHRTNDVADIRNALSKGANALELDVQWGRPFIPLRGRNWYVDHDRVYNWSPKLESWLRELISIRASNPAYSTQLSLLIFDIKTPENLVALRDIIRRYIPPEIDVIFSVASFGSRSAFIPLFADIRNNEGFAIDQESNPNDVAHFFASMNVRNYWYGDGIAAVGLEPARVAGNIRTAVGLRDRCQGPKGVYTWTYVDASRINYYLNQVHVDGIMVNVGGNAQTFGDGLSDTLRIISNSPDKRLATARDSAFARCPNAGNTPPGVARPRRITGTVNMYAMDHERVARNEHGTAQHQINVLLTHIGVDEPIYIAPLGVGGEVRLEVILKARLLDAQGTVRVFGAVKLFEGTSVDTTDLDGERSVDILLLPDATNNTVVNIYNDDEGGDLGEVKLNITNESA